MKNNALIMVLMLVMPIQCFAEGTPDQCYAELDVIIKDYPIAYKISSPSIQKATFEQLANTDKATDYERDLIGKMAEIIKYCSDLEVKEIPSDAYLGIRKAMEDNISRKMTSLIDLYNRKISYGEYIKQRQDSITKAERELVVARAERDEHNANVDANNARINAMQEAQRRKGLADAFGNIGDAIRKSMPPRAINCNPNGFGGVRCQ
jgi:hypothetical protein